VGRISNGWRLAKASWQVLSRDRELLAIPLIAGLLSLLVFAAVAGPGVLLLDGGSEDDSSSSWAIWIVLAVAGLLATWVSVIGQAAVVSGAGQRMDGADPTLGSAFAGARTRTGRLFEWAVLATVVAIVLDVIQERLELAGRILGSLGGLAFSVMSFLALPVIVFEDVGAIDGFKRSSQLLRGTWGEQLTFTFGMGLVGIVAALPGVALAVGLGVTGVAALQVVGVVLGALWVLAVVAVVSCLSAVFKTALYRYARQQPVDVAFETADLSGAFRPKPAR
jgi:Family of unknown function (DUF6159)